MAKFKYIGDPNDGFSGPQTIEQYDLVFVKGEVVDVPDGNEGLGKLRGSSHFVDMSDKDQASEMAERQKALEKQATDKAKAAEDQRKKDETDRKQMEANQAKEVKRGPGRPRLETSPRPPGTVTKPIAPDPFQGRTVEQRTTSEDHTKSGKTKS